MIEEAIGRFRERAPGAQSRQRHSGDDALAALSEGMEIIVPDALPLGMAVGEILEGEINVYQ